MSPGSLLAIAAMASFGSEFEAISAEASRRGRDPKKPTDSEMEARRVRLQAYDEQAPAFSAEDARKLAAAAAKRARKAAKRIGTAPAMKLGEGA